MISPSPHGSHFYPSHPSYMYSLPSGLLALFFRGLLTLSKSFLDVFGIEKYEEQCIRVDVLISEINFGAGKRWLNSASFLPAIPSQPSE